MAPSTSTHFSLLLLSFLLFTATSYVQVVSAENQHPQLLQQDVVTYPPSQAPVTTKPLSAPVTQPIKPPAKPSTPTPPAVTKPPTPSVKAPYTPAPTPPVATPPTPYRPPVKAEECGTLCSARCKLHSRPGLCVRACSTCCVRCKCVPPGTYGNREVCGKCYTDMRTHGDRPKCP